MPVGNMLHYWIAAALLAGSWLFGLDYFYPAVFWAWLASVASAVVMLSLRSRHTPFDETFGTRRMPAAYEFAAILLLLPAAWIAPWPYRMAPLLVAVGAALRLLRCNRLGRGAVLAGFVLLAQALCLELYFACTMQSHDLPAPMPDVLAGLAGLLGIDASADGSHVVMRAMGQTHRLGATWELFLDPATLLFFVGGLTLLVVQAVGSRRRRGGGSAAGPEATVKPSPQQAIPTIELSSRQKDQTGEATALPSAWTWLVAAIQLTLVLLAWLPLRAGLLMGIYLHRILRTDPTEMTHAMNHFFSPWAFLGLLAVPALLAWRFIRLPKDPMAGGTTSDQHNAGQAAPLRDSPRFSIFVSAGCIALAAALFTAAVLWEPVGARREGRVMVVERHSTWEPTQKPYDPSWYGEMSGYNYAAIYAYLEQYYRMSRLLDSDKIDDDTLEKCDVLIIKTPTTRYDPEEVKAVVRFVERGGGLLFIGDHTNFSKSSTIMNDMTRPMGFIFRDDLLFSFGDSPYKQHYVRPTAPHPAAQHVSWMDFAVSCSVDPGSSRGRAVLANSGLWSMGPEYHHENYHPFPQHCPQMRYGAFVQAWSARYGQGRSIAFCDSTIFSNFCTFQPGKAELMQNMVEWLDHENPPLDPQWGLVILGIVSSAVGLFLVRPPQMLLLLVAAGAFGWAVAAAAAVAANAHAVPIPERVRPQRRVVIDRNISDAPLSNGPDTQGNGEGYGLFEQWIARLNCHTVREEGHATFSGNALVVICPSRHVSEDFRKQLEQYVAAGGKLIVLDSPENKKSTADDLLKPFGLSIQVNRVLRGQLSTAEAIPTVDVDAACKVTGGESIAEIEQLSVAAVVNHGKGSVMAIGFGSLWNDTRMGEHWMLEPDPVVKDRYDVLFGLFGPFFDGKPLKTTKKASPKMPELKEFGPTER
jgi:hypothetical protein